MPQTTNYSSRAFHTLSMRRILHPATPITGTLEGQVRKTGKSFDSNVVTKNKKMVAIGKHNFPSVRGE
jgi:hypothetical protein